MEIRTVGLHLGKTWFHGVGCRRPWAYRVATAIFAARVTAVSATAAVPDRHGSLLWSAPSGSHTSEVRSRRPPHAASICMPVREIAEERLSRCRGDRRSCPTPTMRFVPIKTADQLDPQALHRVRDRLVSRRTRVIKSAAGLSARAGAGPAYGASALRATAARNPGRGRQRTLHTHARPAPATAAGMASLGGRDPRADGEIAALAMADAACQRLVQIPGIGPLGATAMVASIGHGQAIRNSRDFAAWLGLVPRQHSSDGKPTLLGISKSGNSYLRRLLIHGARSACLHLHRQRHAPGRWTDRLEQRAHRNVVAVALANKLARIAWAVLPVAKPISRNGG